MAVDSRDKGARAESQAKEVLIKHTGLNWQRTPGSGALNEAHMMKGDLYIPEANNKYCVEVKHYKDDHLTSKTLTDKTPQLIMWWEQATRQGKQVRKRPLLIFKFDRSKWFVMLEGDDLLAAQNYRWFSFNYNSNSEMYIAKLEDWLNYESPEFIIHG